jgi:NADH-quinone oxidoreductase subunit J
LIVGAWVTAPQIAPQSPTPPIAQVSNTAALGALLYTRYVYLFEAAGLILLVAMVGAIVLTLQHKRDVKRQNISAQVGRTREEGVELVEVQSGRGLS